MVEIKRRYNAPSVNFLKFDARDILRTSGQWDFNCQSHGEGFNEEPPECSVTIHTDNSQN